MGNVATLASRAAGLFAVMVLLAPAAPAQNESKNYKELDQEAIKLFQQGKYEKAYEVWLYIHTEYPRAEFRNLNDQDPRAIAWSNAFYASIIREGMAKKQSRLQSPDAATKAGAESAYTDAVSEAKEMMRRNNVPKAAQEKLIKAAEAPLLDALKKK